jgi:WD40 repeat protein
MAFSSDDRTLATGSWDNLIKLWEPVSGRETRTLRGHADWITCLAFSPDGNTLATGSYDKTLRIWKADSQDAINAAEAEFRSQVELQKARRRENVFERKNRKPTAVDITRLDEFTGHYGVGLIVTVEKGRLSIRPIEGEGGLPVSLFANSETEFFARSCDLQILFLRDAQGQVSRLVMCLNGHVSEAARN